MMMTTPVETATKGKFSSWEGCFSEREVAQSRGGSESGMDGMDGWQPANQATRQQHIHIHAKAAAATVKYLLLIKLVEL